MFDPRRSRYVVAALLALLAAVVALNLGLAAVAGTSERWFPADEDTYDWYFLDMAAARFSAAGHEPGKYGALVGLSTTACAIDSDVVAREGPPGYRWLTANNYGGSAHKVAVIARLLAASRIRPDVIVLGVNPVMLSDATLRRPPPPPEDATKVPSARDRIVKAVERLWAVEERYPVKHMLRLSALRFKMRLLERLGSDPSAATAPARKPWEPVEIEEGGEVAGVAFAAAEKTYRQLGYFSADTYPADSPQARELIDAIAAARSTGARVLVALLPEATPVRNNLPPEAARLPREVLARAFGADAPPILDFRDALPDDAFSHPTHANSRGKAMFSPIFARALREVIK